MSKGFRNRVKELQNQVKISLTQEQGSLMQEEITDFVNDLVDEIDEDNGYDDDDYLVQTYQIKISFIELAILNSYLHKSLKNDEGEVKSRAYGQVDNTNRVNFGGIYDINKSYWFSSKIDGEDDNEFILQTQIFLTDRNELVSTFNLSSKKGMLESKFDELAKKIKKFAFNNSEFKGKCIKVKLRESSFRGIEIIDIEESANKLILNDVQNKFLNHFISRIKRGNTARYLLNGLPGTGKTESIREIARQLTPDATFIIPDFVTTEDLTSIMEACEIFDKSIIIMDDIDLYLGSRDRGSYTTLLGQFLSFFDGVKKRKISLLASTNDKGLVDKAAERPGRFNFTLDYGYLTKEQIKDVCDIHLPEIWRIDEVINHLSETRINGKLIQVTGAFIANLADNIKEMSQDDDEWDLEDTLSLITESYKGFYSSQIEKEDRKLGFIK